jgi:hypothetical protein
MCGGCCYINGATPGKRSLVVIDLTGTVVAFEVAPTANIAYYDVGARRKGWTTHTIEADSWTTILHVHELRAAYLRNFIEMGTGFGLDVGIWMVCPENAARVVTQRVLGETAFRRLVFVYGTEYAREHPTTMAPVSVPHVPYCLSMLSRDSKHACVNCAGSVWQTTLILTCDNNFLSVNEQEHTRLVTPCTSNAFLHSNPQHTMLRLENILCDIALEHGGQLLGWQQTVLKEFTEKLQESASAQVTAPQGEFSSTPAVVAAEKLAIALPPQGEEREPGGTLCLPMFRLPCFS